MKLICVGKLKEAFNRDAFNEYAKRLSKYTKLEVIELNDESINDDSVASINKAVAIESERILSKINDKDYVILLAIKGNMLDSEGLSNKINEVMNQSKPIAFVIGGSYGVDDSVIKRANYQLSFSKLTFPHQLFRVMLLEQIYRSFKIIKKEKYHK